MWIASFFLMACAPQPPPAPAAPPPPAQAPAPPAAPAEMQAPVEGARVFFIEPATGSTVTSPVTIKMGVEGMTVAPAGTVSPGTGHHHLVIDGKPAALGEVVPADDTHIHYGKGQTEA